jgi:hypothetical protein
MAGGFDSAGTTRQHARAIRDDPSRPPIRGHCINMPRHLRADIATVTGELLGSMHRLLHARGQRSSAGQTPCGHAPAQPSARVTSDVHTCISVAQLRFCMPHHAIQKVFLGSKQMQQLHLLQKLHQPLALARQLVYTTRQTNRSQITTVTCTTTLRSSTVENIHEKRHQPHARLVWNTILLTSPTARHHDTLS